jgi:phosphopantothenoylcysteine decarboxylase/phosphopantothenate--cysteine ligase
VGFAAEHGEGAVEYGRGKLERKGLDAVVVNDISKSGVGFDAADNEVTILTAAGARIDVPKAGKDQIAQAVLDQVTGLRSRQERERAGAGADPRSPARL